MLNKLPLKRFAKGSILLQSAHFSTLWPTASACQHVALASPGDLSAFQRVVPGRSLAASCRGLWFRELL
jgi:hypothetical protein